MRFVKTHRLTINLQQFSVLVDQDDTGQGPGMLHLSGYERPIYLDAVVANRLRALLPAADLDAPTPA